MKTGDIVKFKKVELRSDGSFTINCGYDYGKSAQRAKELGIAVAPRLVTKINQGRVIAELSTDTNILVEYTSEVGDTGVLFFLREHLELCPELCDPIINNYSIY